MSKIGSDTIWAKLRAKPAGPTRFRTPDVADGNALEAKLACRDMEGKVEMKYSARNQLRFEAEWRWVRRMPSLTERLVVSSPSVCEVWAHRCCDSLSSQHASKHAATTGHPIIASFEPGEDWFYDYRRGDDQGCGVTSATFASGGSTITWTSRESSSQLGIAAALAGVDRFIMNGSGESEHGICNERFHIRKRAINERRTSRTEEL